MEDDDAGDESVTLAHAASGADYAGVEAALAVAVDDDEIPSVTIAPTALALDEDGDLGAYTVVLDVPPSGAR